MTRRGQRQRPPGHRPLSASQRLLKAESLEPRLALAAPEAVGEQFSVLFGELAVGGRGVLSNDTDADGDALSAVLTRTPAHGAVALAADGAFRYSPQAGFRGTDSFDYRAVAGGEESAIATVTITVQNKLSVQEWPLAAGGNGHAYSSFQAPWDAGFEIAKSMAAALSYRGSTGHLTTITSLAESAWLSDNRLFQFGVRLGGYQDKTAPDYAEPAGGWRWVTGEPMTYTAWRSGEPNNFPWPSEEYLEVDSYGTWNDVYDGKGQTYSVEFDAPQAFAGDDHFSLAQDQAIAAPVGALLANDAPMSGTLPTIVLVGNPAHGAVKLENDGSFRYAPAPGYVGRDRFTYRLVSGQGESNAATVELRVGRGDYPTEGMSDNYWLYEDRTLALSDTPSVLGNDTDQDGLPLTATLVTPPEHGVLEFQQNGQFSYAPAQDFFGDDYFFYRATDGYSVSAPVRVVVSVAPVDDPPRMRVDAYRVPAAGPLVVPVATGVLANDSDIDSPLPYVYLDQPPSYGDLIWNGDGSFTYTPRAQFQGVDSFYYNAGSYFSRTIVHLRSQFDPALPLGSEDSYGTHTLASSLTVDYSRGVLANDFDAQGDPLTAILLGAPAHGRIALADDGSFSYVPDEGFSGQDSFWYLATDGHANSAPVQATISVADDGLSTSRVEWPVAVGGNGSVYVLLRWETWPWEPTSPYPYAIQDRGLIGHPATLTSAEERAWVDSAFGAARYWLGGYQDRAAADYDEPGGGWRWTTGESWSYTAWAPGSPDNVDSRFTNQAHWLASGPDGWFDDIESSGLGSLWEFSTYSAHRQFIGDDSAQYTPGGTLRVAAEVGLLANDEGIVGERQAELVRGPQHGQLALQPDGSFSYTPESGFVGYDRFRYRVALGNQRFGEAEVWLKPVASNLTPVSRNDAYAVDEDLTLVVEPAAGPLANDDDWDSAVVISLVSGPAHGQLVLQPNGGFSYRPDRDYSGIDRFVYRATDEYGAAAQAEVSIEVRPIDDPTTTAPDFFLLPESGELQIAASVGVLANDHDVDAALMSALVRPPQHGALSLAADGSFTYRADASFIGTDWFEYRASDGRLASDPVRVVIARQFDPDRPVALGETFQLDHFSPIVGRALENDYDPQGRPLAASLVRVPAHGRVSFATDGAFSYLPASGFAGVDSFLYVASNGAFDSAPAEVRIDVAPGASPDYQVWSLAEGGNGHAYAAFTFSGSVDWNWSRIKAEEFRILGAAGQLASITSAEEQAWVVSRKFADVGIWIGGSKVSADLISDWKWIDGEPWSYTAWRPNNPWPESRQQFALMDFWNNGGLWASAEYAYGYLVEVPLPAEPHLQAGDDVYTRPAGAAVEIAAPQGVLANDWDLPGTSVVLVDNVSHGTLALNADGSFRYLPDPGYRGRDRFTYKVVGPSGETNNATVWLNTGTNDLPPELSDVEYHVGQNGVLVAESKSGERDLYSPFDGPDLPPEFEGDRFGVVGGVVKRVNWEYDRYNRWLRTRRTDYRTLDFSYEVTFNTEFAKETDLYGASLIGLGSGTFIDGATGRELIDSLFLRFSRADRNNGIVQLENQWGQPLATLGSIKQAGVHRARIEKLGDQVTFSVDVAYNGVFQADLSYTVPSLSAAVPKLTNANTRLFMASSVGTDWFDDVAIVSLPRHGLAAAAADPEGGAFAFRVVEPPAHGDLALDQDGAFRYVPQPGFVGVDCFRYTADDGPLTSYPATVTVVVEPRPAVPLAVDDEYTVAQDGRLDVGGPWTSIRQFAIRTTGTIFDPNRGLLWVGDPDNYAIRSIDPATGALGQPIPLHRFNYFDDANYPDGPLALSGDGAFLYVTATERTLRVELATGRVEELFAGRARSLVSRPGAADEIAADGVVYRNGVRAFNMYGTWSIPVSAAAYGPDGQQFVSYNGNLSVSTAEGADYELRYLGQNPPASELSWSRDRLVFKTSDVVIDATTFAVLGNLPQRGLNVVDSARDRIYTLRENCIYVIDSRSLAVLTTLTVPDAPTVGNSGLVRWGADGLAFQAANGRFFVLECNALDGPRGQGVSDNDQASSTEATAVSLIDPPQHGILVLNPDGAFRYEPAAGFVGQDRFVYRSSNSLGASQATVLLNVEASASAPRTLEDSYEVWRQRTLVAGVEVGLLANDADRDSRQLHVKSVVGPSHGALRWQADGSFSYEPEQGYSGPDSFQYIASDGHFDAAPTTVHLQVRPAQFEVQLRAVRVRTGADRVTVLPDSISGAAPGDEIYVELWLQDRDLATPWYQLGTFDLSYSADVLTLLGINDGPVFNNSPPGTIDELGPREADLYGSPGWGKMATLHFRVHGLGPSFVTLTPGHYFFSAPWQEIAWSNLSLSTFAGDANYDNRVDLTDFGVLKGNFGLPSGATAWQGDFDGNGRIDLADFGALKENFGEEAIGASPRPTSLTAISEPVTVSARAVDLLLANGQPAADWSQQHDLFWLAWERERLERDQT